MKLLIDEDDRVTGYVNGDIDAKTIEVSESELNKLIPDSFEEMDWKEVRRYYKLDDSRNIVFDEGYEHETEDEE